MKIHTQRGFTILEVMLTVMIIGIMALLAVPRILDTDRRAAYITAHQIVADMRLARAMCIANADSYVVKFYASEGRYTGYKIFKDGDDDTDEDNIIKAVRLRDEITFEPDGEVAGDRWAPEIIFESLGNIDNSFSGDTIAHVTGGGHQVNIEATVATGKVTIQ